MRVLFTGAAMGGPAGVANAVGAINGIVPDDLFEVAQLAFGAPYLQSVLSAGYCDSSRVVAAVFKAAKSINDDGNNLLFTDGGR
jgi:hypothetical protein